MHMAYTIISRATDSRTGFARQGRETAPPPRKGPRGRLRGPPPPPRMSGAPRPRRATTRRKFPARVRLDPRQARPRSSVRGAPAESFRWRPWVPTRAPAHGTRQCAGGAGARKRRASKPPEAMAVKTGHGGQCRAPWRRWGVGGRTGSGGLPRWPGVHMRAGCNEMNRGRSYASRLTYERPTDPLQPASA
jgi:hypothetical protein